AADDADTSQPIMLSVRGTAGALMHAANLTVNLKAFAVSGQVVDVNGTPLPNVRVVIPGAPASDTTDMNGQFTVALGERRRYDAALVGAGTTGVLYQGLSRPDLYLVYVGQAIASATNANITGQLLDVTLPLDVKGFGIGGSGRLYGS